jgi:hypothetical protein
MDIPLPLDPAAAFERGGDDHHIEVALSAFPRPRVTGVPGAVIDHLKPLRLEGGRQLVADALGYTSHSGGSVNS